MKEREHEQKKGAWQEGEEREMEREEEGLQISTLTRLGEERSITLPEQFCNIAIMYNSGSHYSTRGEQTFYAKS